VEEAFSSTVGESLPSTSSPPFKSPSSSTISGSGFVARRRDGRLATPGILFFPLALTGGRFLLGLCRAKNEFEKQRRDLLTFPDTFFWGGAARVSGHVPSFFSLYSSPRSLFPRAFPLIFPPHKPRLP
jgi:hypothetical protein